MRNSHADNYLRLVETCFREASLLKQKREELAGIIEQEQLLASLRESMTPRTFERWCAEQRKNREACELAVHRYEDSLRASADRLEAYLEEIREDDGVVVEDPYVARFLAF